MVANWLRNLGIGIVLGFLPLSSPLPAAPSQKVAPVAELVKTVDIPYQQFTLDNGLRVIVSTDRKAPVVAVSIWYHVGSKNEPKGKTGFAHLFENQTSVGMGRSVSVRVGLGGSDVIKNTHK